MGLRATCNICVYWRIFCNLYGRLQMNFADFIDSRLWRRARRRPIFWLDQILVKLLPDTAGEFTFFDIGANHGQTAAKLRASFPNAQIVCFEPIAELAAAMKDKFKGDGRITVENLAVSDETREKVPFHINSFDQASSILPLQADGAYTRRGMNTVASTSVGVTSVADYCKLHGISKIDFMKIDVQGLCREVLDGAHALLERRAVSILQAEYLFSDYYVRRDSFFEIERRLIPNGYHLFTLIETDTDLVGSGYIDKNTGQLCHLDAIYVSGAN